MEREEIERSIAEAQWRPTTYLAPHEYVLSRDYPELHAAMKGYLLDHGCAGRFLDREYTYSNIGAYFYWVVGGVLNRARLDRSGARGVEDGYGEDQGEELANQARPGLACSSR